MNESWKHPRWQQLQRLQQPLLGESPLGASPLGESPFPESQDKTYWEKTLWNNQTTLVAGLDEAGRGAWAGPVVAAAVIFKPGTLLSEVDDSKKLTPQKRDFLFDVICQSALTYGVGIVASSVIDSLNILQASLQAMRDAVAQLSTVPQYLLVDGNQGIGLSIPQKTLIGGDGLSLSIGAASILAKVTRDRLMVEMEKAYPQFRFSKHKGYGTKDHLNELKKFGPLPEHRKSFGPIRLLLETSRN